MIVAYVCNSLFREDETIDAQYNLSKTPVAPSETLDYMEEDPSSSRMSADAIPVGSRPIIRYEHCGAVLKHWKQDGHNVNVYIPTKDLKGLKDRGLLGAWWVDGSVMPKTKTFRCSVLSCTRPKCIKQTQPKLSAAVTRVVRARGPYSLMLTIPRLTDGEVKIAFKVAENVAKHLHGLDGVSCWGTWAVVECHQSGVTQKAAQQAIRRGKREGYPYHVHAIIPVSLDSCDSVAQVNVEANTFLRAQADQLIYGGSLPGSLPMVDAEQEIAAIAHGQQEESAPYASIIHVDDLAQQLGKDDYLYDYQTKGMVPEKGRRSDNSAARFKRHLEVNRLLGGNTPWYRASTVQKGNKSFFHVAAFQDSKDSKYRSLVSDNYKRRQKRFVVSASYEGITAKYKVTSRDFHRYPTLSAEQAEEKIKRQEHQRLLDQCIAEYHRRQGFPAP